MNDQTSSQDYAVVISGTEDGQDVCQVVAEGLSEAEANEQADLIATTMKGWTVEVATMADILAANILTD